MAKIALQMTTYGGVHGVTVSSVINEFLAAAKRGHELMFIRSDGDSLLPRRRSITLSEFYEKMSGDVIVTIDHDIGWNPGDAINVAERALELDAIVGGLYSKRTLHRGWGSRISPKVGQFQMPSDKVVETDYIGSGFMAIPRRVIRTMLEDPQKTKLERCWDGNAEFWDFYQTLNIPHSSRPDIMEMLSEDWAFCHRARLAGVPILTDLRPQIVHYGERGFKAIDGAPPQSVQQNGAAPPQG